MPTNYFTNSAFFVSVFSFVIGISFARKKNKTPAVRFFGYFWLTVAFWTYFVFHQFELLRQMPDFWWGFLLHAGCMYVPLIYFHFALHLTGKREAHDLALKIGYGFVALFISLILFSQLFTGPIVYREAYAYPKPGVLYPVYIVFFQVYGFWGAFLILKWARKLSADIRRKIHVFLLLQLAAHVGAMDNYLIMYDINWFPLYPYGLYLILPYAILGSRTIQYLKTKALV